MEFNQVIFGEDSVKNLILVNDGALSTEVIIKSLKGGDIQTKTEIMSERGGSNMKAS